MKQISVLFLVAVCWIGTMQPAQAQSSIPQACNLSAPEGELLINMQTHPHQNRLSVSCDPILTQVARSRAADMGQRAYFGHINPDGYGPNFLVEQAGYRLPDWWDDDPAANYIESIGAGYPDVASLWYAWMNSPTHSTHLLAQQAFYADQTLIGIGVVDVPNSEYGSYFVIITAPIVTNPTQE